MRYTITKKQARQLAAQERATLHNGRRAIEIFKAGYK
jgi:hypothetical protein